MKPRRFVPFALLLSLLFACAPKRPEIPAVEVPAAPFVHALEQRRGSFLSLKAVASAQVSRKGRTRSFDSVGVLLKAQEKFKLEAYGPLGQPLIGLLWNGDEVLLRSPAAPGLQTGGLERLLGADVEPRELCAVLSGNIPDVAGYDAKAFCGEIACVLELRKGELLRRVVVPPRSGAGIRPHSSELYRGRTLLYRAEYDEWGAVSGYLFPRKIALQNPERTTGLMIEYQDLDVNAPLGDDAFTLPGMEETDR